MQKYRLLIMRHAKSDWSEEGRPDFDRPLTARGRKIAKRMGKWLRHNQHRIDRIICSPALRTKQTCQRVAKKLSVPSNRILWEEGIYEASLSDLLGIINLHNNKSIHTLLIIGHNPGLDQLLNYLSRDPPPLSDTGKLLTTAAIAVLDYGRTPITTKSCHAHLQCLIRPKALQNYA
jgi:phosphohistidine phosphatase